MDLTKLKWFSVALVAVGGMVFSVFVESSTWVFPYVIFFVAHSIWLASAIIDKDYPLLWVNLVSLPFDIYAITIRTIT